MIKHNKPTENDLKIANAVIAELGGVTKIGRELHISHAAVSLWRKQSIPDARLMYLKLKYPNLKAWTLEND